ncbi:MAG: hypothetical protein GF400_02460 [Candidatus Eisenbacteria bacterium]|nr:hypothetical protein [Candidatus Eisenbacteria bacterium]
MNTRPNEEGTNRLRARSRRARRRGAALAFALASIVAIAASPLAATAKLLVRVSPERALVPPGGVEVFSAFAYQEDGDIVPADVVWSVIPPRAGKIGRDGRFTAGEMPGTAIIRATVVYDGSSGAGHAAVQVGEEEEARLSVSLDPSSVSLDPQEVVAFDATVTDPLTGDEVSADLRWVVLPDRLGEITQEGLFTAAAREMSGRVAVRASLGEREGVADAEVVVGSPPQPGLQVSVLPANAVLEPGEEFAFRAVVFDREGETIEADVSWVAMPARLGVIDQSGLFTAGPDEGAGRIVASVATIEGPARGFARVEVRSAGPAGIRVRVRPREAAVLTGGDVQFEADVIGPEGAPLEVPVDWSLRPDWIGTIGAGGLFTASQEMPEPSANGGWMGTIVASIETNAGQVRDASRVIVREGGPALRLRIVPHNPVVAPDREIRFESRVIGAEDPLDWTTEWAVFPEDLGTITPDGLFTANPLFGDPASSDFGPREGYVGARATLADGSTLTDRTHVRIRIPGEPIRIKVRPALAVVPPGESTEFDAIVLGPDGQEVDLPVRWKIAPAHLGTISGDGIFTAADLNVEPGSWQRPHGMVVAELRVGNDRVFRGAAAVVIDLPDPEIVIRISPEHVTVPEGETFQFSAEAHTVEGDPVELELEWRLSDPVVGTIDDSGLFAAAPSLPQGHSRRATVLAGGMYNGRVYWDRATVRVTGN